MKNSVAVAALSVLALAGCASHHHDLQRLGEQLHAQPLVTVREGIISVSPEPLVFKLTDQNTPIVWRLPAGHTFPADGIEILGQVVDNQDRLVTDLNALKDPKVRIQPEGKRAFVCAVDERTRQTFSCLAVPGLVKYGGFYRYVIRVLDKDGKRLEFDPNIWPVGN